MRRLRLAAALLIAAQVIAAPALAAGAAPDDAAVAAIAAPEAQFRALLARVIFDTSTMRMAAEAMGIEPFCAATRPAVDKAVEAHLPAWRANLVAAYRENVPADVLAQAAAKPPEGARALIAPHMDAVGAAMHKASSPLLKEAAGEVLGAVAAKAETYDIKTVDMEKRRAELKAGAADGSTFCGLFGRPKPAA